MCIRDRLQLWGGGNYTNKAGYMNEQAVSDKRIVTANGTGYLEFAKDVYKRQGLSSQVLFTL